MYYLMLKYFHSTKHPLNVSLRKSRGEVNNLSAEKRIFLWKAQCKTKTVFLKRKCLHCSLSQISAEFILPLFLSFTQCPLSKRSKIESILLLSQCEYFKLHTLFLKAHPFPAPVAGHPRSSPTSSTFHSPIHIFNFCPEFIIL